MLNISRRTRALIKALLDRGAEVNVLYQYKELGRVSPLVLAALYDKLATVRLLLEHGADPNLKTDDKPLNWVVQNPADLELAQALLDRGADINAKDKNRWTALEYAVYQGNVQVVRWLLKRHADVHIPPHHGRSILSFAIGRRKEYPDEPGYRQIIALLKKAEAK